MFLRTTSWAKLTANWAETKRRTVNSGSPKHCVATPNSSLSRYIGVAAQRARCRQRMVADGIECDNAISEDRSQTDADPDALRSQVRKAIRRHHLVCR